MDRRGYVATTGDEDYDLAVRSRQGDDVTDPFVGEIRLFPYTFVPRGWALCDGRLLPIAQHTALFALLGTTYGGNGTVNFALPDLRGRVAVSSGQGPGLSPYFPGESGGAERVTLKGAQMPSHTHRMAVNATSSGADSPDDRFLGRTPEAASYAASTDGRRLNPDAITRSGGGQPHENRPPHLVLSYCIALEGIFPSRD